MRLNLASCSGCNGDTHILTFAARSWRYWRRRSRERANLSVSRPLRRLCELVENFFFSAIGASWGERFGFCCFFLIFFLATVSRNERALVTLTQLIGRSTDQDSPTIRRRGATVKQPLVHRYRNYLRKTRFDEASVKFWLCVGDRWETGLPIGRPEVSPVPSFLQQELQFS